MRAVYLDSTPALRDPANVPCPRCGVPYGASTPHSFGGHGAEPCSGKAWCSSERHLELTQSAAAFATLAYVGQSEDEDLGGEPVTHLWANCPCGSTLVRVVPAGSAEALVYLPKGKVV